MENKTKLRLFENTWRTEDLLTKTEIFRSMLKPYTEEELEEELKKLTKDKLVETYNHYADTYLDLIMKRCIGSEGFKIFLNLSKDRTIIERRYGNVSNYENSHSEIKILNGSEYEWFRDSDKLFVENMLNISGGIEKEDYDKVVGSFMYEDNDVWIESSANTFCAKVYLMKNSNSELITVYAKYVESCFVIIIPIGSIVEDIHEGKHIFFPIYMNKDAYTISFDHTRCKVTDGEATIKNANPLDFSLLNIMDALTSRKYPTILYKSENETILYKSENESFTNNDGLMHLNALNYFIENEFRNDYIRIDENSQYVKIGIECRISRKLWNGEEKINYIMLSARLIDLLKEIGELRAC